MPTRLEQLFKESLENLLSELEQNFKKSLTHLLSEFELDLQTLQAGLDGLETGLEKEAVRSQHSIISLEKRLLTLEQNQKSNDLGIANPD